MRLCGFVRAQSWVLGNMLVLGGSEGLKVDSSWIEGVSKDKTLRMGIHQLSKRQSPS